MDINETECNWCGEVGHEDGDCLARDPFAVETWNEAS